MEAIQSQLQALALKVGEADEVQRYRILDAIRDLQYQLETPKDTFIRLYNTHLQLAVVHVGIEANIFSQLAKDGGAQVASAKQLAESEGGSVDLFERVLRYLASMGYVSNPGPGQYGASKLTHLFASPLSRAGVTHAFETNGPAIQAFPSFLASTKYQDIDSNTNTPFQRGHQTALAAFEWMQTKPKNFAALQSVMTAMQSTDWLQDLDVLDKVAAAQQKVTSSISADVEPPFFVDIGGGHGHQCTQLLSKYPHLAGRVVLQDLPEAIDRLTESSKTPAGVEALAQDFFTPQPQRTHGAKFFYLRRILHDWPDEGCLQILGHLRDVMDAEGSRILIDEVVLPDVNAPWQAAMQDLSMGILFGGKERTRGQWEKLVDRAGLKIVLVKTYSVGLCASVLVLEKV